MLTNVLNAKFFVKAEPGKNEDDGKSDDKTKKINMIIYLSTSERNSLTLTQMEEIIYGLERKYLLTGTEELNVLYLIYSDNIERDKALNNGNIKFWIIDVLAKQLIIYEDQPEDFDGLKSEIENQLNDEYNGKTGYQYQKRRYNEGLKSISNNMSGNYGTNENLSLRRFIPYVTILIMLINIIIFAILESIGSTEDALFMIRHGAAYTELIFGHNEYYRLFTCMFLHFGIVHLCSNMVALLLIGSEVERLYGRLRYMVIYVITGLAGSILAEAINYMNSKNVVSAGASGAVYGIQGALMILVFRYRNEKKSKVYKILLMLLFLIVIGRTTENVDNYAHLGGFVSGVICGKLFILGDKMEVESKEKN